MGRGGDTAEQLEDFMSQLNFNERNIRLTFSYHGETLPFLDLQFDQTRRQDNNSSFSQRNGSKHSAPGSITLNLSLMGYPQDSSEDSTRGRRYVSAVQGKGVFTSPLKKRLKTGP